MSTNHTQYKTAESVSPRHPDKLCDQISDALLDAYLDRDPESRVAIDVAGGHGKVFVVGEVTSTAKINVEPIIKRIAGNVEVITKIVKQSPEIAKGVDTGGAGDQGIMVGYACNETPQSLPLEVVLARKLNQYLYEIWPYDGKTQVTLKNGIVEAVVASFQNAPRKQLTHKVNKWIAKEKLAKPSTNIRLQINPAGDWHVGGFEADSGLTGRKLVEVYCYLAYAIGYNKPLEATVIIDGKQELIEGYDLTPRGITTWLDLKKPQFEKTARYGHFGHPEFTWEQ